MSNITIFPSPDSYTEADAQTWAEGQEERLFSIAAALDCIVTNLEIEGQDPCEWLRFKADQIEGINQGD